MARVGPPAILRPVSGCRPVAYKPSAPNDLRRWLRLSIIAAVLSAIGNAIGLAGWPSVYGRETTPFVNQAIAQDAVNLVIVAPAIAITALLAGRGSIRARLVCSWPSPPTTT